MEDSESMVWKRRKLGLDPVIEGPATSDPLKAGAFLVYTVVKLVYEVLSTVDHSTAGDSDLEEYFVDPELVLPGFFNQSELTGSTLCGDS